MAYPIVKWTDTIHAYKPRVVTIADSYWRGPYFLDLAKNCFSNHEFWYYNAFSYNYDPSGKFYDLTSFDLQESIEKNDVVFLMSTSRTLNYIGYGIIDELYNLYKSGPVAYRKYKSNRKRLTGIDRIKKQILLIDDNWYKQVKAQAAKLGISIDSCAMLNATFAYDEAHKNDPPLPKTKEEQLLDDIALVKTQILADPKWCQNIKQQANKMKISVDSCINRNARWVAEQKLKK